jgi:hypothetical protein
MDMTTGIFRSMVLARAIAVEPIARAFCADLIGTETPPFSRKSDRWRSSARRTAPSTWATAAHAAGVDVDDADLP